MASSSTGHMQTIFEGGKGNALQACVATVLKADSLSSVPNFMESGAEYMDKCNEFLGSNYPPLAMVKVDLQQTEGRLPFPAAAGTRTIVAGKSPRGDFKHCCVYRVGKDGVSLEPCHDPHPDARFLESPFSW
eukprot:CAMPEP_0171513334 /NCGR_PEP_ID=MMETSP0959-20130129/2158_1 /TAXON_ID=87120 /ORGANISM="Aurantiochytrium limacinum, Strain ATCCMYA-1381" /LENGTH=131 /DNA_ID=CAMNT_0012051391 /DNA_START=49 /DNA_END=441 /DNA_ORIENTATION=+